MTVDGSPNLSYPAAMTFERITIDPAVCTGKPCIRGLRFTVYDLASYLASGMTEDEILKDFPYLEKEDFQAVYEFFASLPERIAVLEASR